MRVVSELRKRDRVTTTKNRALRALLWQLYAQPLRSLESLQQYNGKNAVLNGRNYSSFEKTRCS